MTMERQFQRILVAVTAAALLLCTHLFISPVPQPQRNLRRNLRRRRKPYIISDPKTVEYKRVHNYFDFEAQFLEAARSFSPITDKVTTHSYQLMYGRFLMPFYLNKPSMKMLEIGLGCDMNYEPGASVALWKHLFPLAELWEAEYDGECVEKSLSQGNLDGIHPLVGDQNDLPTLDRWIEQSGGADFDVVIDDGGHQQCQIWTTFQKLWPLVRPGGLYFIEDLQVSRNKHFNFASSPLCDRGTNVVDMLKAMVDDTVHMKGVSNDFRIDFVFCQSEACVVGKKKL